MTARKKNLVPLFGVAFIVAILSTGVFYGLFVGKLNSASTPTAGIGKVWVAAKALDRGSVMKPEDLQEINWPQPPLPAGAVTKLDDLAGKTLVEPIAAHELISYSHIASPKGGPLESGGIGIPQGQRAVSLQVQDSSGVVALLKPGHRIDIQVVGVSPGAGVQEPQIRTMLENVQVLTVGRDTLRGSSQIITVLASPREVTLLGLADSTAKVRIALRNPIDQQQENPGSISLSGLFRATAPNAILPPRNLLKAAPVSNAVPRQPAPSQRQVQLLVRVTGAKWEQLSPHILDPGNSNPGETLQVASFRPNESLDTALAGLETVASSRLTSAKGRETGLRWTQWERLTSEPSDPGCGLDIQFSPRIEPDGRVRVRVQPEVTWQKANGRGSRRLNTEVDVADGQSFLVRGFAAASDLPLLWEKLFAHASRETAARELIVVVTPRVMAPAYGPASD